MVIKTAVSTSFDGANYSWTTEGAYDSSTIGLGQWIQLKNSSPDYAGPFPVSLARPFEDTTTFGGKFISVVNWDTNNSVQALSDVDNHWIFIADAGTGSASARIIAYIWNNQTQVWTYQGKITLTLPAGTHTVRGFHVERYLYTTGTITRANGTGDVVGSGTAWVTNRIAGGRIGIGATNPPDVIDWREITSVNSNTSITCTPTTGSTATSSYVVEELRVYVATTCDTATNGGLFVAKGISISDFIVGGTTINAAVSTDNVKAVYWLQDAGTVTNTAPCGIAVDANPGLTSHMVYVVNADGAASARVYKYDARAVLTVSSGASTDAFSLKTSVQTVVGNLSQYDAITMATPNHGAGIGVASIYGVTDTYVYRIPTTNVFDSNASFVADHMPYAPAGSSNTYQVDNTLSQIRYAGGNIDRFLMLTNIGSPNEYPGKAFLGKYDSAPNLWDRAALVDSKQQDQSTADAGITPFPSNSMSPFAGQVVDGILYLLRGANTQANSQVYALPLGADWEFAAGLNYLTDNRLITPVLYTPDCIRYSKLGVSYDNLLGSDNLGQPTEPFRVFWRTAGITDNTGNWNPVNPSWDLSGVSGSQQIQFMFEFRTFGPTCIPARIFGLVVTYDQMTPHASYLPSVAHSSTSNKRFAWRFATAFDDTVPNLTVYLYDDLTGDLILTDTTNNTLRGTFEKSTNNGGAWGAYDTVDKTNETTYIRYTPTVLPNGGKFRAYLV